MSDKQQQIPVYIANMAVDALEKRIATLEARNAALAAENERLRKAGDEMRNWIICEGYDLHCVDDWLAAREGGSK